MLYLKAISGVTLETAPHTIKLHMDLCFPLDRSKLHLGVHPESLNLGFEKSANLLTSNVSFLPKSLNIASGTEVPNSLISCFSVLKNGVLIPRI